MSALQAALSLAEEYGLPVFPCRLNAEVIKGRKYKAKSPLTPHGFEDASRSIEQIAQWWERWPEALIGVPTGKASGLFVIDVDPRGAEWYREHAQRLQSVRVHQTQRGHHLLYCYAGELGCTTGSLVDGVDTRGEGGYVIWWPAHGLDATGELTDLGDLPEWLKLTLEDIESRKAKGGTPAKRAVRSQRATLAHGEDRSKDLYHKVGIDLRNGLTDGDIISKHIAHPHAADQADPERAVRRCIEKTRADYQRQQRPGASHQRTNGHDHIGEHPGLDGTLKMGIVSAVHRKELEPIWPGYLYAGKVTVVAGVPGDGKSVSSLDIVARFSAGKKWPVGDGSFSASPVILLTAEDDPADTIAPRLDCAGADDTKVYLIEGTYHIDQDGKRSLDLVSLTDDLAAIEGKILEVGARMLVIDPLTSFADSDTNKTRDMRRLLDGLAQMAARTGIAILVITHMNKRSDARKAMQMIAGSHVIIAAVRIVLVTARDPDDKQRRLILPIKLNVGPDTMGFAFRIVAKPHSTLRGEIATVAWESKPVSDMSADDVLIDSTPRAQAAVEKSNEVQDWLRQLLANEPVEAATLWRGAKENHYGERRVRSGLKAIKAKCESLGYQGKWHYRLSTSDIRVSRV